MQDIEIKKRCGSCRAVFLTSAIDDEEYCSNCRNDSNTLDEYYSKDDYDYLVNSSCRTNPVFYD